MARPYSLQDELAELHDQRVQLDRIAERAAGYERSQQYQAGLATADDIGGRVARFGSTYERNTQTLRQAAAAQPNTLAGRVAASELAGAADRNAQSTPDTQAEARRLAALNRLEAAATRRREIETRQAERGHDRER